MMLENRITTDIENTVKNHTELVNETVQNVSLSYIDKVKNSTKGVQSIDNIIKFKNVTVRGKGSKININQRANINASLTAQTMVRNETSDRTNLATVMKSALDQAITSQADADVSQKAVNVLEQMDQNDGGVEGVINKGFDTVNNMLGGGNTEQDVKNISETRLRNNTENILKMRNAIKTSLSKDFGSETKNLCASQSSIENIVELEKVKVLDGGEINIEQVAALDSAVKCFNEVFNIREISTDISADSGMDAKQALDNITKLKQKQDVDNKLKQTKLQKNILSSLFGNCMGMIVLAVIAIAALGVVGKMGGKGGDSGGSGGKGGGMKVYLIAAGLGFLCIVLFAVLIYVLVEHSTIFKKGVKAVKDFSNKFSASRRFIIEEDPDNKGFHRIYTLDKKYQLVCSPLHSSQEIEPIPITELQSRGYISFAKVDTKDLAKRTYLFKLYEDPTVENMYKILTYDDKLALKYNLQTNKQKRKEKEYELIDSSFEVKSKVSTFDFMIKDIGSKTGSEIKYVNKDSNGNDNGNYSVLYAGDKATYGKKLNKIGKAESRPAEFRRQYTKDELNPGTTSST